MKKITGLSEKLKGLNGRVATMDGEEMTVGRVLAHFLSTAHNKSAKQDMKCRRLAEKMFVEESNEILLENAEMEALRESVESNGPGFTAFIRGRINEVVESASEVSVEERKA